MAKRLVQKYVRGLALACVLLCSATSYAQIGEWIANQIREEIEGEIGKITNHNANILGSFGAYIWDSVVDAKCESDLKDKAKELRDYEIDESFLQRVPNKYPTHSSYWTMHSEIVPKLYNHANAYFHVGGNIKFSNVANSKIDKYAEAYIDSIAASLKIENIESVLSRAVLDSLKLFEFRSELTATLLNDIKEHPNLAIVLNNHPEAVRIYAHSIGARSLRSNPQHLLYWAVQADSHKDKIPAKQSLINPRTLYFTQNEVGVDILNGETRIAQLRGDNMVVLDINLMNLAGRPNTTYVFGNNSWQTDEHGRVVNAKQHRNKMYQKKCKQKSTIKAKAFGNILEIPETREIGYYNSPEYGAPEVLLNVYVNAKTKENKTALKLAKKSQKNLLKKNQKEHKTFTNVITATYLDNGSIPSNIVLDTSTGSRIHTSTKTLAKSRTTPDEKIFIYRNNIEAEPKTVFVGTIGKVVKPKSQKRNNYRQPDSSQKRNQLLNPNTGTNYDGKYTLRGKINGAYAVTLNLEIIKGVVSGTYYYDKYKRTMKIKGNISNNGIMNLIEYENDRECGTFDRTTYKGEFRHYGRDSLPFYLTLQ